jgi:long-chain fatty acid transport protein
MIKSSICFSIILTVAIFFTTGAFGQGIRVPGQDTKAVSMGNAFTARADNASAVFYNPAGIAFLESPLALRGNFTIFEQDFKNETQGFRTNDKELYIPNGFGATNLFNKYLSFGYGAFSEFGLETSYPKTSPVAPIAYFASLKTMDNRFVWALRPPEPFDWVSVGGGFDLLYGKTRTKSITDLGVTTLGVPTGVLSRTRFTADGYGWGWNLGALVKCHRMHSVGISFASKIDLDVDGRFKASPVPGMLAPVPELSYPATTRFELPARITWGYMFEPVEWFKFQFDLTWINFNSFDDVQINIKDPMGFVPSQVINFDFDNTWVWGLGVELGPFKRLSLRAGWAYLQTPVPEKSFNSIVPDANRSAATMGIGYEYKNISLDFCYAAIAHETRKIENNVGAPFTSVDGTWKGFTNQIMMAMSYKM